MKFNNLSLAVVSTFFTCFLISACTGTPFDGLDAALFSLGFVAYLVAYIWEEIS